MKTIGNVWPRAKMHLSPAVNFSRMYLISSAVEMLYPWVSVHIYLFVWHILRAMVSLCCLVSILTFIKVSFNFVGCLGTHTLSMLMNTAMLLWEKLSFLMSLLHTWFFSFLSYFLVPLILNVLQVHRESSSLLSNPFCIFSILFTHLFAFFSLLWLCDTHSSFNS